MHKQKYPEYTILRFWRECVESHAVSLKFGIYRIHIRCKLDALNEIFRTFFGNCGDPKIHVFFFLTVKSGIWP